jgi:hypothetical protein
MFAFSRMEKLQIEVPVHLMKFFADCAEVGLEGTDHHDTALHHSLSQLIAEMRTLGKQKADSIKRTAQLLVLSE